MEGNNSRVRKGMKGYGMEDEGRSGRVLTLRGKDRSDRSMGREGTSEVRRDGVCVASWAR